MTDRDKILLNILYQEENQNISFFHKFIEPVANLVVEITQKLGSEKVNLKRHEELFNIHYFKFTLQTLTIRHLLEGTPLKAINLEYKYRDISSIYSVTRSLMETALTVDYLYYNFKTEGQATFRYLMYCVSGLKHRQTYPATEEETIQKKASENGEIKLILKEIKENAHFMELEKDKRDYLLSKFPAFEISTIGRIQESGFKKSTFYTLWQLFSNYSHSEYIEAMQLRLYERNVASFESMVFNIYRVCFMLNCHQVIRLTERFKIARDVFDQKSLELKTIIEFYNKVILGGKFGEPSRPV